MVTDRRLSSETKASSLGASAEASGHVRELVEALTAVGNYLAVANRILAGETTPATERLADILDKSMGQYERAANTARELHKLYVHGGGDDDGPPGFRR